LSKKRSGIQTFFSTTTYAPIPLFGTLLWKAVKIAAGETFEALTRGWKIAGFLPI
jgi:hypothetical protein